jgi:hypothetical protein
MIYLFFLIKSIPFIQLFCNIIPQIHSISYCKINNKLFKVASYLVREVFWFLKKKKKKMFWILKKGKIEN